MTGPVTIDISALGRKRGARGSPKGRAVDPQALADVQALLGDAPRRRDLLIEYLHRIQDAHGCLSRRAPRRARAGDEARDDRGLRGRDVLPPLRRREGRRGAAAARSPCACARRCRARWPAPTRCCADARSALRSRTCASSARRASAAASTRRPRSSAAIPSTTRRPTRSLRRGRRSRASKPPSAHAHRLRRVPCAHGGYRTLVDCVSGKRTVESVIATLEHSALRGPGRRRLSVGPQVEDRARRARAAADGGQHRRRRAGHVQGSPLPRARSAPLPRGHADRRVGGRHRRRLRLPARRIRGVPRAARARDRRARARPAVRAAARSTCAAARAPTSAARSPR